MSNKEVEHETMVTAEEDDTIFVSQQAEQDNLDVGADSVACQMLKDDFHFFCGSLCFDLRGKVPEAFGDVLNEFCPAAEVEQIQYCDEDESDHPYRVSEGLNTLKECHYDETDVPALNTYTSQAMDYSCNGEVKQGDHKDASPDDENNDDDGDDVLSELVMILECLEADADVGGDRATATTPDHQRSRDEMKEADTPVRVNSQKSRLDDKALVDSLARMLPSASNDQLVKAHTFDEPTSTSSLTNTRSKRHRLRHPKSARVKRRYPKAKQEDMENKDRSTVNTSGLMEDLGLIPLTGIGIDESFDYSQVELLDDLHDLANDLSNSFIGNAPSWSSSPSPAWSTTLRGLTRGEGHHNVRSQQNADKPDPRYPNVINVKLRPNGFPARPLSFDDHHEERKQWNEDPMPDFSAERDKKRFWRRQTARKIKHLFYRNRGPPEKLIVEDDGNVQVTLVQ